MLKKFLVCCICASLSNMVYADYSKPIPYVGANLSTNTGNVQVMNIAQNALNFGLTGATAGIFAGMTTSIENFYMSGEVLGNFGSLSSSTKPSNGAGSPLLNIKSQSSLGLSFIPAHRLWIPWHVLIFGRVGLVLTGFQVTQNPGPTGTGLSTFSKSDLGLQLGCGLQTTLYKNFDGRIEYIFSDYRHFNAFGNQVFPQNNQGKLSLIYNIA